MFRCQSGNLSERTVCFCGYLYIPFVGDWPYNLQFSLTHFQAVFSDDGLLSVYKNSIFWWRILTALFRNSWLPMVRRLSLQEAQSVAK